MEKPRGDKPDTFDYGALAFLIAVAAVTVAGAGLLIYGESKHIAKIFTRQ